jgi:hypothetical protein
LQGQRPWRAKIKEKKKRKKRKKRKEMKLLRNRHAKIGLQPDLSLLMTVQLMSQSQADRAVNYISTFTVEIDLVSIILQHSLLRLTWRQQCLVFSTFTLEAGLTPNTDILRMPTLSQILPLLFIHLVLFLSRFFFRFILNLVNPFQFYHATSVCNLSPWISLSSPSMKSVPPSSLTHPLYFRHGFWTAPLRLLKPLAVSTVMPNDP